MANFSPVLGQNTPAGTVVFNQATAVYVDSTAQSSASNVVQTRVQPVFALNLSPPGTLLSPAYVLSGAPGDTVYCRYTIANLGNAADSMTVTHQLDASSTTSIAWLAVFNDINGNGVLDSGEDDLSFLAAAAGGAVLFDVAVALPPGGAPGDAFVGLTATSRSDVSVSDQSVFRVTNTGPPPLAVHVGPAGNPRALPGGEGSADDVTSLAITWSGYEALFANDVLFDGAGTEVLEVSFADTTSLPPGVTMAFADSTGRLLSPPRPTPPPSFSGVLSSGETRRFHFVVRSSGAPLGQLLSSPLDFRIAVRSMSDSLRYNTTIDRIALPQPINPAAVLAINQTFREPVGSIGDVVTMVVTVTNISDSVDVSGLEIVEIAQPSLDFLSSRDFAYTGGALRWNAGTLAAGETASSAIKFVVNTRTASGKATATGTATGTAPAGERVNAGPAVSLLRIENDEFGIEGIILGDVYIDDNGNGRRDRGEAGVSGAAVYLESGEYAIADSNGVFSLPRVFSGYRVVRLDERSLPPDVGFADSLDAAVNAPRANERLVHLLPAGNARVSFPLVRRTRAPDPPQDVRQSMSLQEKVSIQQHSHLVQAVTLPSSHFGLGKAELQAGADAQLQPVAVFMREHPAWRVLIEGHTDSIPTSGLRFASNHELSVARAQSVRRYLAEHDIDDGRIIVVGRGETQPRASNATIEGRRLNRRVELSFIPPGADFDDVRSMPKTGGTLGDLAAMPDTFRVAVFWELTTTSPHPRDAILRIDVPERLLEPGIEVELDGAPAPGGADGYRIGGFMRTRTVRCEIKGRAAGTDTALVEDIVAHLELKPDTVVTFRPFVGGRSSVATTVTEIAAWWEADDGARAPTTAGDPGYQAPQSQSPPASRNVRFGILDPEKGEIYANRDQIHVRARVPLGSRTTLRVGDRAVVDTQIGQHTVDVQSKEELLSWFGVRLEPGWNVIALEAVAMDGSVVRDSVRVAHASRPSELSAASARRLVPADGRTSDTVVFLVRDAFGLPVMDGMTATVIAGATALAAIDARPEEIGLQVTSRDGEFRLPLRPSNESGNARVELECQGMRAATDVVFIPPRRPLLASGVVDLRVGAFDTHGDGSGEGLENFGKEVAFDAESRLFIQGPAPAGFNITARLDSKRRYDDPLFKTIDPERQYPVFGDASSLHNAAPATGGNYVSVDKGESFLRYGDFRSPLDRGEFLTYQRVATGLNAALIDGGREARAFVTRTDFVSFTDEIDADGTSGFYYLARAPIVENSERVIIETRDRYQPEKVLDVRMMVRNRDYTVNPFDGSLLFKAAVPAFDRYFNPVVIVVTYEVESDQEHDYLLGFRGDVSRGERYRVGASAVTNTNDADSYALYGLDGAVTAGRLRLSGEFARSNDDNVGDGGAYKVEAAVASGPSNVSVYLRSVDGDFSNPSFRGSSHELESVKSGFDGRLGVSPSLFFTADGYLHRLHRTDEERRNLRALVNVENPLAAFRAGLRFAGHDQPAVDESGVLTVLGASVGDPRRGGLSTTWEQSVAGDVVEDYPNRVQTTVTVPFAERFRALGSHEYLTSAARGTSNQLSLGVEGRLSAQTTAYTRYAMERTAADERLGAVSGVKQRLRLNDDVSGTIGVEGFRSLSGRSQDEYVSVATGMSAHTPGIEFAEGQYEYRWQRSRTRHMIRLNGGRQLGSGVALLLKNTLGYADVTDNRNELSYHGTLAGAYRPFDLPVQALAMARTRYERYTPVDPEAITWRLVLSGDVNYTTGAGHEVRLKYAFKRVEDYSYGISETTNSDLLLGQYVHRLTPAWDVDLWGRTVRQRETGGLEAGAGLEVGRLFFRSIRVAAGYSINGFEDPDVLGTDAWVSGFGLRLQLILSDWILSDFNRLEGP